jgi:hypothetical protein
LRKFDTKNQYALSFTCLTFTKGETMKKILCVIRYALFGAVAFVSLQAMAVCEDEGQTCEDLAPIVVEVPRVGGDGSTSGGGAGGYTPAELERQRREAERQRELARIAEEQRQATCQAAIADWAGKDCANRRTGNRPRDNSDINFVFPFPDGYNYEYLRGATFAFQRALWDDLTGGAWNNYYDYIGRFYQDCETFAGGVRTISVPLCKQNVNTYFGQTLFGPSGYAGFQQSQAAIDAKPSRDGQVCTNLAAALSQNQCN